MASVSIRSRKKASVIEYPLVKGLFGLFKVRHIQGHVDKESSMRHLVERVLELSEAEQAAANTVAPPMDENSEVELQALLESLQPRIRVYGVGGAGCNAVNRLFDERLFKNSYVTGYAINTDAQALLMSPIEEKNPDWKNGSRTRRWWRSNKGRSCRI